MKLLFDLHTHTVASGHAFSTLKENIEEAAAKGLKAMGTSDHYSAMPGSAQPIYFTNFKAIKEKITGSPYFYRYGSQYHRSGRKTGCGRSCFKENGLCDRQSSCSLCKSRNQRGKYQCIDRSYEKSICEDHRTSR